MSTSTGNSTLISGLLNKFCTANGSQSIDKYVGNLTSSYADTGNESSMVAASVIMFALAGIFFNLNLFSRFSDVSAILDPKVRLFLSSALSLFLPVMSYLFSEAKNAGKAAATATGTGHKPDLSLQAGMILVWMLLVELLRKKVDEIRMRGYSGTIQRAGRVVWLGSLVFFNVRSVGRKAVFGILWVLCATKVVQRIAFTEVGKRNYAYGKNARLVSSYMTQLVQQQQKQKGQQEHHHSSPSPQVDIEQAPGSQELGVSGDDLLKSSKFVVMGEEDMVVEPTADGYKLRQISDNVVTVGKVWAHDFTKLVHVQRLKRLCLSFALFKLLRRRFEHLPPVPKEETRLCRDLLLNGVYDERTEAAAAVVLDMMNDEVNFLCEYYHSVIPVVLASPFFFLANYFLLPVVVLFLCLMTVVLCGDGDARYAFGSIQSDNFAISSGVVNTTMCLLVKAFHHSPPAFFTVVDFSITFLLFVIFFYEEIWEFIVFLLSNWFMVSLIHNYVAKPRSDSSSSTMFVGSINRIMWVRRKMSLPVLGFKQFSLLSLRWPLVLGMPSMFSLLLRTSPVPNSAKHAIMESVVAHSSNGGGGGELSNGKSVLRALQRDDLLPACRSDSVAEVILTWHVATAIMEAECSPDKDNRKQGKASQYHTVATRLSKYCAYLVAFHPELLPDNQDKTERVLEAAKAELKGILGCASYYLSCRSTRINAVTAKAAVKDDWKDGEVVHDGTKLGNTLRCSGSQREQAWKLLADVWTEIVVYLAPSSDEERVIGHESVLVQGGEFITVLWALATHTGITRPEK